MEVSPINLYFRSEVSQVKNEHYAGVPYYVELEDSFMRGTNSHTGRNFDINLDELLELVDAKNKPGLKTILTGLSGEVLEDLSIETTHITHAKDTVSDIISGTAGGYHPQKDRLGTISNHKILVHELGHALDNIRFDDGMRDSLSTRDEKFKAAFKQEVEAYEAAGNSRYKVIIKDRRIANIQNANYCTRSEQEMFAECYSLLMTGDCASKNVLLRYFPKTLEQAQNLIGQIRAMPDEKRHIHNRMQSGLDRVYKFIDSLKEKEKPVEVRAAEICACVATTNMR